MSQARRHLLVLTRHPPLPDNDGSGAYLTDLLRHVASAGWRVTVVWLEVPGEILWRRVWRAPAMYGWGGPLRLRLAEGWSVGRWWIFGGTLWRPFWARTQHRLKTLWRKVDPKPAAARRAVPARAGVWESPPTADETARATAWLERERPDVVLASYAQMAPLLATAAAAQAAVRVCLTHDVASERSAAAAAGTGQGQRLTADLERAWLAAAEVVVAISGSDGRSLRPLAPTAEVVVAPKAIRPVMVPGVAEVPHRLLFVGSGNAFNAEGLAWFLREVWPALRAKWPAVELEVVGRIAEAVRDRPTGTIWRGLVEDLNPVYAAAAVVIVPLQRGSGVKIKLVEAAAYGKCCVVTPPALQGVEFMAPAVVCEPTAAGQVEALVRLLGDVTERRARGRDLQQRATRELAPERCYGPLVAALEKRVARRRG